MRQIFNNAFVVFCLPLYIFCVLIDREVYRMDRKMSRKLTAEEKRKITQAVTSEMYRWSVGAKLVWVLVHAFVYLTAYVFILGFIR